MCRRIFNGKAIVSRVVIFRLATEHRLRISKVEDVIITDVSPAAVGGLLGFLLTVQDIKCPTFDFGSRSLRDRFDSELVFGESVCSMPWMTETLESGGLMVHYRVIKPHKRSPIDPLGWKSNQNLLHTIRTIRLWGPPGLVDYVKSFYPISNLSYLNVEIYVCEGFTRYKSCEFSSDELELGIVMTEDSLDFPRLKARNCDSTVFSRSTSSIRYIFGRGEVQTGRFLAEKAEELKIPRGPLRGLLKKGEVVTLPDGRVIDPSECCEQGLPGVPYVMINGFPGSRTLDFRVAEQFCWKRSREEGFGNHEAEFERFLDSEFRKAAFKLVVHLSPWVIQDTKEYREALGFIVGQGGEVYEIGEKPDSQTVTGNPFVAAEALHRVLGRFLPGLHPQIVERADARGDRRFLSRAFLCNKSKWKMDEVAGPDLLEAINVSVKKQLSKLPKSLIESAVEANHGLSELEKWPRVRLLGTGAAIPSKYRNVSSSLVEVDENSSLLLDCGEGTVTQLRRICSTHEDYLTMLKRIKIIFLSHKHADHIVGVVQLCHVRGDWDSLAVIGPEKIRNWFQQLVGNEVKYIVASELLNCPWTNSIGWILTTCLVQHTYDGSYALKLAVGDWKLAFSGDLRPCSTFKAFTRGVDVLIHEATFEDELIAEAESRNHAIISEALKIAESGSVGQLILTHFSQRYPKVAKGISRHSEFGLCYGLDYCAIPSSKQGSKQVARGLEISRLMVESLGEYLAAAGLEDNKI